MAYTLRGDPIANEASILCQKISQASMTLSLKTAPLTELIGAGWEIAKAIGSLLGGIWSAGMGAALMSVVGSNFLHWYDALAFGIGGTASVVALLATDGVAFGFEVVGDLVQLEQLIESVIKYVEYQKKYPTACLT